MKTFILILTFYSGALGHGDSVSLTTAEFSSQNKCLTAGKAAADEFSTFIKPAKFVCVEK